MSYVKFSESAYERETYHSTAEKGVSNRWTIFFRSIVVSQAIESKLLGCAIWELGKGKETVTCSFENEGAFDTRRCVVKADIGSELLCCFSNQ